MEDLFGETKYPVSRKDPMGGNLMNPPFAYYGGKTGMASRIIDLFPPHDTYIEPFFGSGAVFFAKGPSRHEIVNDIDGSIVCFFRQLRDNLDELERVCALTPYARDEYVAARNADGGGVGLGEGPGLLGAGQPVVRQDARDADRLVGDDGENSDSTAVGVVEDRPVRSGRGEVVERDD